MTGPYVPPEPPSSSPNVPPGPTPPKSGPPWGKIVLFGCLGLLVIGLVITGISVAVYLMNDRETPTVAEEIDTSVATPGETSTTPSTVTTGTGALSGSYEVRTGNLGPGDPETLLDGTWYDAYPMSYPVGTTVTATLRSSDFDAYLTVVSPTAWADSDDDSGGGTDSRVTVTIDEGGTWKVWATTLRAGETGSYTLTIETSP